MSRSVLYGRGEEAVARFTKGETVASLAQSFGVPELAIRRLLSHKSAGLRIRAWEDRYRQVRHMSEAQAAYLAGLLDGEGHIGVRWAVIRTGRYPRGGVTAALVVSLTNTSAEVIRWLVETTGCGRVNGPYQQGLRRPKWYWQISGYQASAVLNRIRPYLIIKAHEADLFLEMVRLKAMSDPVHGPFNLRRQAEIVAEMARIQRRGGGKGPARKPENLEQIRTYLRDHGIPADLWPD